MIKNFENMLYLFSMSAIGMHHEFDNTINVENIYKLSKNPPQKNENGVPYKVYNIGNHKPEHLLNFIETLERCLINEDDLVKDFNFKPDTSLHEGLTKYVKWYKLFYNI